MRPEGLGNRRAQVRFEVVGAMPGTLFYTQALRVLNIGASGALVEAELPLSLNGEYRVQVVIADHVAEVTVKVRRIAEQRPQGAASAYQIGFEFLGISPETQDVISRLVAVSTTAGVGGV